MMLNRRTKQKIAIAGVVLGLAFITIMASAGAWGRATALSCRGIAALFGWC